MKFKKVVCALLAFALTACAFAGCTPEKTETYDIKSVKVDSAKRSEIEKEVDKILEYNEFCGSAAISLNKDELYNKAYGYADAIKEEKLTAESCYQINELTKNFTGIAVLMLEKSGKLNLSDTLDRFFNAEEKYSYLSGISIGDLLTNNISFGSYYDEITQNRTEYAKFYKILSLENSDKNSVEISNMVLSHILNHGVDETSDSTESNYYLLGKIITAVSGTSYRNYIQENIFDELKMENSGFVSTEYKFSGFDMDNKVWHRQGEYPECANFGFMYSSLGIVSSSSDMSKFYTAFVDGKLMGIDIFRKLKLAPSSEYCGFNIDGNNVYCSGRMPLYCAYAHINMANNEVVSMLSNCVGKTDINTMGNELYEVISSKINGIIISEAKKS